MPPFPNQKENPPQETPRVVTPPKNKGPLKSLRTFQGDMAETLQKTGGSVTSVAIAEQKKRERVAPPEPTKESKTAVAKNRVFVYFGSIFLVLGILVIIAVYMTKKPGDVPISVQNSLLGYTVKKDVGLETQDPKLFAEKILTEQKSDSLPVNSVIYLNILSSGTTTPLSVSDFATIVGPTMPSSLKRSFEEKYMLGIYNFDTDEPFIILTSNDYGQTYSGMLKWESSMVSDLAKIFSIVDYGTSTPYTFEDESIKNKDLRVVKDPQRKTVLLYSFLDKNTLVITKNESIWGAISAKFQNSLLVR